MYRRKEFNDKFERNFKLIEEFKIVYENLIEKTNSWNQKAFMGSDITNFQYLTTLKQISEKEYSEKQREAVKTVFIHVNVLKEYIDNLDVQYNNLKKLFEEISENNNKLISNN